LLQENPPILNCGCQLMQVDLCNGYRIVVAVYAGSASGVK